LSGNVNPLSARNGRRLSKNDKHVEEKIEKESRSNADELREKKYKIGFFSSTPQGGKLDPPFSLLRLKLTGCRFTYVPRTLSTGGVALVSVIASFIRKQP